VVLPGGVAAFHGPMKAAAGSLVAEKPKGTTAPAPRR
jgi:hypothetical protein